MTEIRVQRGAEQSSVKPLLIGHAHDKTKPFDVIAVFKSGGWRQRELVVHANHFNEEPQQKGGKKLLNTIKRKIGRNIKVCQAPSSSLANLTLTMTKETEARESHALISLSLGEEKTVSSTSRILRR